jgi:UTP--glucose-1-phosphate uridylyltransferase
MKAVIPAAGLGTRLLPATKSVPKELHTVRGKPAIQWTLEEAVQAGLTEFVVVTTPLKFILKHYLTPLGRRHPLSSHPDLADWERLLRDVSITFVDQDGPYGLGHALLHCRKHVGKEPFALMLPDNVVEPGSQILGKLLRVQKESGLSVVALRQAPAENCAGFVTKPIDESVHQVIHVIPRNHPDARQTVIRNIGRSVLYPDALEYLADARTDAELDEVPALAGLATQQRLLGVLVHEEICHLGEARGKHEFG